VIFLRFCSFFKNSNILLNNLFSYTINTSFSSRVVIAFKHFKVKSWITVTSLLRQRVLGDYSHFKFILLKNWFAVGTDIVLLCLFYPFRIADWHLIIEFTLHCRRLWFSHKGCSRYRYETSVPHKDFLLRTRTFWRIGLVDTAVQLSFSCTKDLTAFVKTGSKSLSKLSVSSQWSSLWIRS
jgi:hypothetical protein